MSAPTIDAYALFRDDHDCHPEDCPHHGRDGRSWRPLLDVTLRGVTYVSDRYIAARLDVLTGLPEDMKRAEGPDLSNWPEVPDSKPAVKRTDLPSVWLLDKIERAELTVHESTSDIARMMNLYSHDVHVGFVSGRSPGEARTVDSWAALPAVRRVAKRHDLSVLTAGDIITSVLDESFI